MHGLGRGAKVHYPKYRSLCITCNAPTVMTLLNPEDWPAANTKRKDMNAAMARLRSAFVCTADASHQHETANHEYVG